MNLEEFRSEGNSANERLAILHKRLADLSIFLTGLSGRVAEKTSEPQPPSSTGLFGSLEDGLIDRNRLINRLDDTISWLEEACGMMVPKEGALGRAGQPLGAVEAKRAAEAYRRVFGG